MRIRIVAQLVQSHAHAYLNKLGACLDECVLLFLTVYTKHKCIVSCAAMMLLAEMSRGSHVHVPTIDVGPSRMPVSMADNTASAQCCAYL